jgi:hypothetical protein
MPLEKRIGGIIMEGEGFTSPDPFQSWRRLGILPELLFLARGPTRNLGGVMKPVQDPERPDQTFLKWRSLPLWEKRRQFRELVRSPYWQFLPEEIRERLRKLTASKEGNGN